LTGDITVRADIVKLVDSFYNKVKQDPLLEPVFRHLDFDKHMPTMYNFWSSMLLGDQSYQGNPFQRHVHLAIDAAHFTRWLELFTETVDQHFAGTKAGEAKDRARSIAALFQHKLGLTTK
jgi:hemoglobin